MTRSSGRLMGRRSRSSTPTTQLPSPTSRRATQQFSLETCGVIWRSGRRTERSWPSTAARSASSRTAALCTPSTWTPHDSGESPRPLSSRASIRAPSRSYERGQPSYIQLAQLNFGTSGYYSASMAYRGIGEGQPLTNDASAMARVRAGREKYYLPTPPTAQSGEERIARTMKHLAAVAKRNPRVPFSTCDGRPAAKPRGVDLLFPVRLGALSSEPTLLSGPVTIVGKLIRAVRGRPDVRRPALARGIRKRNPRRRRRRKRRVQARGRARRRARLRCHGASARRGDPADRHLQVRRRPAGTRWGVVARSSRTPMGPRR